MKQKFDKGEKIIGTELQTVIDEDPILKQRNSKTLMQYWARRKQKNDWTIWTDRRAKRNRRSTEAEVPQLKKKIDENDEKKEKRRSSNHVPLFIYTKCNEAIEKKIVPDISEISKRYSATTESRALAIGTTHEKIQS